MYYFKKTNKTDVLYWRYSSILFLSLSTVDIVDNLVDKSVYRHFSMFSPVDNCSILSTCFFCAFTFCKFMYILLFILHNYRLKILFLYDIHCFLKIFLFIRYFLFILLVFKHIPGHVWRMLSCPFFFIFLYFLRNNRQNTPAKILKSLRLNTSLLIFFTGNFGNRR